MQLIIPVTVTEALLTSSVAEADHPVWSNATTYALADRVIKAHRIWESASAGNLNHDPETSPTWWLDAGPTNRWAMFDDRNSSITTDASPISVEIAPGDFGFAITGIALLNLVCSEVRVRIDDGGIVYDETVTLAGSLTNSTWWDYFFGAFIPQTVVLYLELPSYYFGTIMIDITGTGNVSCGVCALGQLRTFAPPEMGVAQGARVGIVDYSRKTTNDFGDIVVTERAYSKRSSLEVMIPNILMPVVYETLALTRATPAVWIGNEDIEPLVIFGFYKSADILIAYPNQSLLQIELEGLT